MNLLIQLKYVVCNVVGEEPIIYELVITSLIFEFPDTDDDKEWNRNKHFQII